MLGFSQLERGNLRSTPQVGPLGDALRELAERAQPALDRAGAALELDVAPDLRARSIATRSPASSATCSTTPRSTPRDADDRTIALAARDVGDRVEIVVADHGPGVARRATPVPRRSRAA